MRNSLSTVALLFCLALPAFADGIDFTQGPSGELNTATATYDGVTFVAAEEIYNLSDTLLPDRGGAICSFASGIGSCDRDMTVRFNGRVSRLAFDALSVNADDRVFVKVYRGTQLLGTVMVDRATLRQTQGTVDLSGFGRLTRIVFDYRRAQSGIVYGNFHFNRITPAADRPGLVASSRGTKGLAEPRRHRQGAEVGRRRGARAK